MKLYSENLLQDLHQALASTFMNSWYIHDFLETLLTSSTISEKNDKQKYFLHFSETFSGASA